MVTRILPLELKDVSVKRRGKRLIGPINATVQRGGITIILGPNGSGKTTLLKVMHGVERLSTGQVRWAVSDQQARHHQGYVFQTPIMLRRSVADNLHYPLQLRQIPRAQRDALVAAWADKIGLCDHLSVQATRLSGGEKQRLALGRALIRRPEVLFLDEPCANLDGTSTRAIEALLLEAHRAGTRVIMTTHDLGQAKRLANEVIFMLNGTIKEMGPAHQMFENPQAAELKAYYRGDIVT
ncbi:MAG: ATP-binding cassette domain-containing protein [Roseobacter sp.]